MQSLEEYEREKEAAPQTERAKTGIACPSCGAELLDDGLSMISRVPPMKRVTCDLCESPRWCGREYR